MPFQQKRAAVIIGRLRRVAQAVGGIAIHAGLACHDPLPARPCCFEKGIDAGGVDRGVAANGRGAVGQRQVKVAACDLCSIGGVVEAHLLGEGVAVQPVDQPLAPAGDDPGLRVVHMGIHETRHQQRIAMIHHLRLRMGGAQIGPVAHIHDMTTRDQHSTRAVENRRLRPCSKGIGGKAQGLAQKQGLWGHELSFRRSSGSKSRMQAS